MKNKNTPQYGVIGLGRFGTALVESLTEAGKDVLVIDNSESKIRQIRQFTEEAFVVSDMSKESLIATGIQNCQTVIVCIGERIDVSILTTLTIIQLGVPEVIAKAMSNEQGNVLEMMGAKVIYPERDMAIRLASRLLYDAGLDFIELEGNIHIAQVKITTKLNDKTVEASKIRNKFNLNIIALERNHVTTTDILPTTIFKENDIISIIGKSDAIRALEEYLLS